MYYVYILTNKRKTVLYTGITNNLSNRVTQHSASAGNPATFTGRYNCHHLVYYEQHQTPAEAIRKEKLIKGKSRKWKNDLISSFNPEWRFMEHEVFSE